MNMFVKSKVHSKFMPNTLFYLGICGTIATLLIVFLVYDSPLVHKRINVEEKQFLLPLQNKSHSSKVGNTHNLHFTRILKFFLCLTERKINSVEKDSFFNARLVCSYN